MVYTRALHDSFQRAWDFLDPLLHLIAQHWILLRSSFWRWENTQKLRNIILLTQSWRKLWSTNFNKISTNINDSNYLTKVFFKKIFLFVCFVCYTVSIYWIWLIYLLAWLRNCNILKMVISAVTQNWQRK